MFLNVIIITYVHHRAARLRYLEFFHVQKEYTAMKGRDRDESEVVVELLRCVKFMCMKCRPVCSEINGVLKDNNFVKTVLRDNNIFPY